MGPGGGGGGTTFAPYTSGAANGTAGYDITIEFTGNSWTQALHDVFVASADRLTSLITGDLPNVSVRGKGGIKTVDDITITAELGNIDGLYGVKAAANALFTWTPDLSGSEQHLNSVLVKRDIPNAYRLPRGVGAGVWQGATGGPATLPVAPPPALLFLQALSACGQGGASDLVTRIVTTALGERLGQPFVVENRVTSGGIVGTQQVAESAPDGYTLLGTFDTFAINPYLFKGLKWDPVRDFAPLMQICRYPQVLLVHPSLGVKTVKEFVALAKEKGASLNYGSAGPASSSRLAYELFKDAAGIETVPVHYKGGGPAIQDLIGGQVQVMLIQGGGAIPQYVKTGKLVALAVSSRKRLVIPLALFVTWAHFRTEEWLDDRGIRQWLFGDSSVLAHGLLVLGLGALLAALGSLARGTRFDAFGGTLA